MSPATKDVFYKVWLWIWYAIGPVVVAPLITGEVLFEAFKLFPSLLLISFAGITWAVCDSVENEHYFSTIFSKFKNVSFWYKMKSWNIAPKIFGYKIDAWHLFKSATICLFVAAIVCYTPITQYWIVDVCLLGYYYNIYFNVFYTHLFVIKPKE